MGTVFWTIANVQSFWAFAWSIADILRGDLMQSEYGEVIPPFIVLRRINSILEGSKQNFLDAAKGLPN